MRAARRDTNEPMSRSHTGTGRRIARLVEPTATHGPHGRPRKLGSANSNWKNAGNRVCIGCGGGYRNYSKRSKYCSPSCYHKAQADPRVYLRRDDFRARTKLNLIYPKRRTPPRIPGFLAVHFKNCQWCETPFVTSRHSRRNAILCVKCAYIKFHGEKREANCSVCSRPFIQKSFRKTCSPACRLKLRATSQLGALSHRWRGGVTEANILARNGAKTKEWRRAVFARDDWTCQMCGVRGGKLDADHIKPWSAYPELRYELSNGRTLCRPCHLKTDTWGHRALAIANALRK